MTKRGDELLLVYDPSEHVEIGENFQVVEEKLRRGLLVQVIEENLMDVPGVLEDVVRREALGAVEEVVERMPSRFERLVADIKNMKMAKAKVRKELRITDDGKMQMIPWTGWTPSRAAKITAMPLEELVKALEVGLDYQITIGENLQDGSPLEISAYDLQGINLVVGKKGTGKSHLAKTILLGLIKHGAQCIVFDINDEYSGLRCREDGGESEYHGKIFTLEPNPPPQSKYTPLKLTLGYIGLDVMYSVMVDALQLPDASAATLREKWFSLEEDGLLTLENLYGELEEGVSAKVAEAIHRRLKSIEETGIICESEEEETRIEDCLEKVEGGGAIVVNLKAKSPIAQRVVVQTIISKVRELMEQTDHKPIFIFAEEAHLYLERTAWLDLVTRMRHLGVYQFYMTNTPTSIDSIIVRQTDNIFLFNLTHSQDIYHLLPATRIDDETVKSMVPVLPPRTFIALGQSTGDYPFIARTLQLPYRVAGTTRLLWTRRGS